MSKAVSYGLNGVGRTAVGVAGIGGALAIGKVSFENAHLNDFKREHPDALLREHPEAFGIVQVTIGQAINSAIDTAEKYGFKSVTETSTEIPDRPASSYKDLPEMEVLMFPTIILATVGIKKLTDGISYLCLSFQNALNPGSVLTEADLEQYRQNEQPGPEA